MEFGYKVFLGHDGIQMGGKCAGLRIKAVCPCKLEEMAERMLGFICVTNQGAL